MTFLTVAAAGLAIVSTTSSPSPNQLFRMAGSGGATTTATVTGLDVSNHNTCNYRYSVGSSQFRAANPCGATAPGQTIRVWYLRSNPALETDQSPTSAAISLLALPLVIGAFMAAFAGLLCVKGARFVELMQQRADRES